MTLMRDRERLAALVETQEEFDRVMEALLPTLLDGAARQTRRFLRETGRWESDNVHEKLALRWGYELVERFLVYGRTEVPCRPLFLFEGYLGEFLSRPDPFCYHPSLISPLGRFLEGLLARAVLSRDALTALFYHLYGWRQVQVVRTLGLGSAESQRVYKSFERWRQGGWQRMLDTAGLSESDLASLEQAQQRSPEVFLAEAAQLTGLLQAHYRKSEPDHYPCLSRSQWSDLFRQEYGFDYRSWHLALCHECLVAVSDLRRDDIGSEDKPRLDPHIRPLERSGVIPFLRCRTRR